MTTLLNWQVRETLSVEMLCLFDPILALASAIGWVILIIEFTGIEALALISYEKKGVLSLIETLQFNGLQMLSNEIERLGIDCRLESDSGINRSLRLAEVFIMQNILTGFILNSDLIAVIGHQ